MSAPAATNSSQSPTTSSNRGGITNSATGSTPRNPTATTTTNLVTPVDDDKRSSSAVVVTFHVVNCRGPGLHLAPSDYSLKVQQNTANFHDLIQLVFNEVLVKENLTGDAIYSHLWEFIWDGKVYKKGWSRSNDDLWAKLYSKSVRHIDDQEPRYLRDMDLTVGKEGKFSGESGSFLLRVTDVSEHHDSTVVAEQPQLQALPTFHSDTLSTDWIRLDERERMVTLAAEWESWYSGNNEWKSSPYPLPLEWELVPPTRPEWNGTEEEIILLLLQADAKFTKSWNTILQYAFPERSKTATSGRWYMLRKSGYYTVVSGDAAHKKIDTAKRLAREKMLKAKSPVRRLHPLDETEKRLRKRGLIDDSTPADKKRRLLERHCSEVKYRDEDDDDDSM